MKISAVIADPVLCALLAAGLAGHGLTMETRSSLSEAADEAAKGRQAAVLIFDSPAGAKDSRLRAALRENPRLLPLLVAADAPKDFPARNVFTPPLRLGALLDRIIRHGAADSRRASFALGPFTVSPGDGTLTDRKNGRAVKLTEKERDILLKLYDRRGGTVDRRELLDDIWGYAEGIETHTLETHIYRLRQKIEADPARPEWLLTDEEGYRLAL